MISRTEESEYRRTEAENRRRSYGPPEIPTAASVKARIDGATSERDQRSLKLIADLLNAADRLPVSVDAKDVGNPSPAVLAKVRAAGWKVGAGSQYNESYLTFDAP